IKYAMAIRNFKKFFRRNGKFVRQPREEKKSFRQRDDKKIKSDRKFFRCDDQNHLIGDCPKPPLSKDQKAFIGGCWSDNKNEVKDKPTMKRVSWLNRQMRLEDSKLTKTLMSKEIKLTKNGEADSVDSTKYQGEALVSVYNLFAQLMNDLERNDIHFPIVTINAKFLNSFQPEWLKYVTQVRLAKRLTVYTFDDLFDYLQQFKKLVNTSRAKKLEKSHDSLALVAHTGLSSRNTSSYYVTHPTSVVDYNDEYQQDDIQTNFKDPLTCVMLLLARAITQNFSNPTNNHLHTSSNTRNQAVIQGDQESLEFIFEKYFNCSGKGYYARNCPKPRVWDSKYFMEQMLLAKQDEAGVILIDE
nr:zf-CCHC domain-containing protein/UBN2 domain-containing protein [Tanacetum cinerariifolium]